MKKEKKNCGLCERTIDHCSREKFLCLEERIFSWICLRFSFHQITQTTFSSLSMVKYYVTYTPQSGFVISIQNRDSQSGSGNKNSIRDKNNIQILTFFFNFKNLLKTKRNHKENFRWNGQKEQNLNWSCLKLNYLGWWQEFGSTVPSPETHNKYHKIACQIL